ncbi:DKNYY domain-containing protein [Aquimarina brevivitae]|uniref:DKNYY family protein n=1 Tax=Aquimarina brevivitae TaxID=323412 RepID=A0A4Q7NYA5_9FLAO|nr:DKNYY domain-containing protein [Aquimarina brevivitae]RZS92000.1 DKNYY family protein [Aquimarina brevivitae]
MKSQTIIIKLILIFSLFSCSRGYEVREDGVYYLNWNEARGNSEFEVEDADINSFRELKDNLYGKDEHYVFYKGEKIEGANPDSFKLLKNGYSIDNIQAYYYGKPIEKSTSKEFEIIDSYYSKDFQNIFYTTESLNVCSVKNFKFVYNDHSEKAWERWTTDGCNYYIKSAKVPTQEYENLKIYKGSAGISSDSKYVYYYDRNIYYNQDGERILDTIDIKSFEVIDYIDIRDKFGCINVYHGRRKCE